ncbi:EamA family transporter [Streptomyces sp. NPDC020917]|uniref:EamA family transporter n=1 Tax=Streptomyces sp. NPDC020917 TaxID=3365102 RepID=UPI0037912F66
MPGTPSLPGVRRLRHPVEAAPAWVFVVSSAVFHYLGPSFAVLLFARVGVLGVAWLRIAGAAAFFLAVRRPLRVLRDAPPARRRLLVSLGVLLAAMNAMFYLAVDRLPLSTVGAVEFLGVIAVALAGTRSRRNLVALACAVAGVAVLADVRLAGEPAGFAFAFANCAGFVLYIVLGHRIASTDPRDEQPVRGDAPGAEPPGREAPGAQPGGGGPAVEGPPGAGRGGARAVDQLGACMVVAALAATPFGAVQGATAFAHPLWLLWGLGVALCSSVIPYVSDQLAMARLPRATFAFLLALLPASATVIGLLVLRQVPTWRDVVGVAAVVAGVALHREAPAAPGEGRAGAPSAGRRAGRGHGRGAGQPGAPAK